MDNALATAMHAMQTTVATFLGSTPGALDFSRYMFLNVPLVADWQTIYRKRENHVNKIYAKRMLSVGPLTMTKASKF